MEKRETNEDVSRLIHGSMRPFDEKVLAASGGAAGARRERELSPRMRKLKTLLSGEVILNVICLLLAVGFLALAASNFSLAGNFLSIDSLFLTLVCLMMAGIFLVNPAWTAYEKGLFKRPASAAPVVEEGPIHFEGSLRLFLSILGWLLALTLIEVFLAYIHVPLHIMLTVLIGLSVIKAALIMAYFMHLRFERLSLVLTLVPILVVCICLMFIVFPDSFRSLNLRSTPAQSPAAIKESQQPSH
ncbi:MAG TPA: cytochrome C oxidase subunit IV family protein [Pyrinomonadaceae bacterium]|jgi:cytochrome c oxidase subunit 4